MAATPRLPLLISCQGGSPSAQVARQTAAALDEQAIVETAEDVERLAGRARAGRAAIALDGCASGCSVRLLQAKGVPLQAALNLAELGVDGQSVAEVDVAKLATDVAARIRLQPAIGRPARAPRPVRPDPAAPKKRTHGVDDYLLAIDALASAVVQCGALADDSPTLAAHVSHLLSVSRVSAGQMLARLHAAGLIERSPRKELMLTAKGRVAADRAVRRHRLLECLASDFLGYTPAQSYEQARLLDGAFDDEAVERASRALGDPCRCPHGWPVDAAQARDEGRELSALATLAPGEEARVERLVEQDGPALAQLYELGLVPGVRVTRVAAGATVKFQVRIGDRTRTVDSRAATKVLVRRGQ
jgi:Mn-dependent DtxR family transcriptional regulator/uncharacterized metal-binding protein